jgi:hypothetical protein
VGLVSGMGEWRRLINGSAVAACALAILALMAVVGFGGGGDAVELEGRFKARGSTRHYWKHSSSKVLVKDLKRLLEDVEHSIKARRARRDERSREDGSGRPQPVSPDEKRNLGEVDHIMDGLESLAGGQGGGESDSFRSDGIRRSRHREDRGRDEHRRDAEARPRSRKHDRDRSSHAEHRLRAKHAGSGSSGLAGLASSSGHSAHASSGKPIDPKKAAILAKMKALQAKIEGDFKQVSAFGKQAGYVPPPKIPQMT